MGRDGILQQTRLKFLSLKYKNKIKNLNKKDIINAPKSRTNPLIKETLKLESLRERS